MRLLNLYCQLLHVCASPLHSVRAVISVRHQLLPDAFATWWKSMCFWMLAHIDRTLRWVRHLFWMQKKIFLNADCSIQALFLWCFQPGRMKFWETSIIFWDANALCEKWERCVLPPRIKDYMPETNRTRQQFEWCHGKWECGVAGGR